MRDWVKKRIWLFLWGGIFFIIIQFFRLPDDLLDPKFFAARSNPETESNTKKEVLAGGEVLPEGTKLWWENELTFQSLCFQHRTTVRLVAFRIISPDALPAEIHNVGLAANLIKGQIVPPGAIFSTNKAVGPRTSERHFQKGLTYFGAEQIYTLGGGICRLASALYNGAILADLEIVERWPHSMPVPYVPPGQDATIATYKDLKFRNTTGAPLLIWTEYKDQTLYLAFYGREKPPKVKWHHEILARWPYQTEYRVNPLLRAGEERVVSPGADGLRVRSWVTVENADGERQRKELGVDSYYPKRQVVEVNPLTFR